ncbi:hypothetical protein JTB14_038212 [Gonioctena quinquepunctata]|nr:hypothetical protein JTB14_038212 [Gonioctena quinquepunctata]
MATEEKGRARLRQHFHDVFVELVSSKCSNNEEYQEMLESVKLAKTAKTNTTLQYRRLKRFDICSVRGVEKLIARVSSGESSIKYNVTNDDMFDIVEKLVDLESVSPEKKSLRQLANKQSLLGGQDYKRCNCKTKCMTNK